jgi:predicted ABC-type transport system involved in lysophospholipase L1 biosynthesis ATPase subunit
MLAGIVASSRGVTRNELQRISMETIMKHYPEKFSGGEEYVQKELEK